MLGCVPDRRPSAGVRMQAAQSRVGKVLSNWAMWPPIDGCALDQVDREAGVGDLEGGRDAGDAAAHDQRGRVDGHPDAARAARARATRTTPPATMALALAVAARLVRVDPRDLLADRDQLAQVGVEAGPLRRRRGTSSRAGAASRRPRRRG